MSPAPAPPADAAGRLLIALREIADRIPGLRAQKGQISEQDTKRILITPAIQALGWNIHEFKEVRNEYRLKTTDNPVDYALFLNHSPVLFVEAKPLKQELGDRKSLLQSINYANAAGVHWCVLTNGAEWRIYKVHHEVEADRKLFVVAKIETPEGLDEAVGVLALLTRESMQARTIEKQWRLRQVDLQVQAALQKTLKDEAFAKLVRKRAPLLSLADIRHSLGRARIAADYPRILQDRPAKSTRSASTRRPAALNGISNGATQSGSIAPAHADPMPKRRSARQKFQSIEELIGLGRLKVGDMLTIRGREKSSARVLDGRHVIHQRQKMTFNEWGQRVTGWSTIQIYAWACLPDGRTLNDLRDVPAPVGQRRPRAKKAPEAAQ